MQAYQELFAPPRHHRRPDPPHPPRPGRPPGLPERPQHAAGADRDGRRARDQRERRRRRGRDRGRQDRRQRQPLGARRQPRRRRPAGAAHRPARPLHRRPPPRRRAPPSSPASSASTPEIERLAGDTRGPRRRRHGHEAPGGEARRSPAAPTSSSPTGGEPDVLLRLVARRGAGHLLPLAASTAWRAASAGCWPGSPLKGSIAVDPGASKALCEQRRSLLPAGVRDVTGGFKRGDAVAITDGDGRRIACGIANYSAEEIIAHPRPPQRPHRGDARPPLRRRSGAPR